MDVVLAGRSAGFSSIARTLLGLDYASPPRRLRLGRGRMWDVGCGLWAVYIIGQDFFA